MVAVLATAKWVCRRNDCRCSAGSRTDLLDDYFELINKLGLAILCLFLCIAPKLHAQSCVTASQITLAGNLRSANGLPSSNYTLSFRPSQQGYIAGCGVNIPTTAACATSVDGSVVGLPNPLTATTNTTAGTGSLTPGIYYSVYAWYDAAGHITLPSPESRTQLSSSGSVVVNPPTSGIPAGAVGMQVYISTISGTETLQGQTTGSGSYVQSSALAAGASPQISNTTLCGLSANDAIWPTGTGYVVSLTDSRGNAVPGYPMQWQLLGAGTTINLSNGLPYYHGVVLFPVPILTAPLNHGVQSITGPLSLSGYNLLNVGKIGVGTGTPGWSIDVENGFINTSNGYLFNGGSGTFGQCLVSNGTAFIPGTCSVPQGQPYYYQDDNQGVKLPSRGVNNFIAPIVATDDAPGNDTQITLQSSGATPGTYSNPTVTIDQYGRVTSVSAGTTPLQQHINLTAGICTTTAAAYGTCSGAVTWPNPSLFPSGNYNLTCTPVGPITGVITNVWVSNKTATTFEYTLQAATSFGAVASSVAELDCTASF